MIFRSRSRLEPLDFEWLFDPANSLCRTDTPAHVLLAPPPLAQSSQLIVTTSTTNPVGSTLQFEGSWHHGFIQLRFETPGGVYTNAGTIQATGSGSAIGVVNNSARFVNTATGKVFVTGTDSDGTARAGYLASHTDIENYGLIEIVASGSGRAIGFGGIHAIVNFKQGASGVLRVTGNDEAFGVFTDTFSWAGAFDNAGLIEVTGAGPNVFAVWNFKTFVNSGIIRVVSTGDYAGVAVLIDSPAQDYVNSGTIEADYAFYASGGVGITIHNSGAINGAVDLGRGDHQVFNTGSINGPIYFGDHDGPVLYDGAAGHLTGSLFLGHAENLVKLGSGGEAVYGGGHRDTVHGGAGSDFFEVFRGTNVFHGAGGFDTLSFAQSAMGVTVNLAAGTASGAGTTTFTGVERILGSLHDDTLRAGSTGAELFGLGGRDTLMGGAAADKLVASGDGATATGGGGADQFIYEKGGQQLVITDFRAGGADVLRVYGYAGPASIAQQGADTLISLGGADSILLKNIQAASITSGEIVYSAGPFVAPSLPPSYAQWGSYTIVMHYDLTIVAGETLNFVDTTYAFVNDVGYTSADYYTLENFGKIYLEQAVGKAVGMTVHFNGSAGQMFNRAGGIFSVSAQNAYAAGFEASDGSYTLSIQNDGLYEVSSNYISTGSAAARKFTNSVTGELVVSSAYGIAVGVEESVFANAGTMNVYGAGYAVAMSSGEEPLQDINGPAFTNSGQIHVASGVRSYGIFGRVDGAPSGTNIQNSGVLTADVAVMLYGSGGATITNTGTINGAIRGADGADIYSGAAGFQSSGAIDGAGGDDTLIAGAGSQGLFGGAGSDKLTGGAGDDVLVGGTGADILTGGSGNDEFRFAAGDGQETITDFTAGGSEDRIEVTGYSTYTLQQVGADLKIIFDANNFILLKNVQASAFTNADILMPTLNEIVGDATDQALIGSTGADSITAHGGDDEITGGRGNDVLTGGLGSDVFQFAAGDGRDVITDFVAGGTDDRIHVTGFDTYTLEQVGSDLKIVFDWNNWILLKNVQLASFTDADINIVCPVFTQGGPLEDDLKGGAGNDVLLGGLHHDTLRGGDGDDVLWGEDGSDTLHPGYGNDWVDGGAGIDTIVMGDLESGVVVDMAAGTAVASGAFVTFTGIEHFSTTRFADTVLCGPGDNFIAAGDGDDLLVGGSGFNQLYGQNGDDTLVGGSGNDNFQGGDGVDTVDYSGWGAGVRVSLETGGYQDTLSAGSDFFNSIERLKGTAFADELHGDGDTNEIDGGAGADALSGGAGTDTLTGGAGNDLFLFEIGDDVDIITDFVAGGVEDRIEVTGFSTYSLSQEGADLRIVFDAQNSILLRNVQQTDFSSVDINIVAGAIQIVGTGGQDELFGTSAPDHISGLNGHDVLVGFGGNDLLFGGEHNDTLRGGADDDLLDGGNGADAADYSDAAAGVTVSLKFSDAQNTVAAGWDTFESIENLIGSAFGDILSGNALANFLQGGSGDDRLDGAGGADVLQGDEGDDWYYVDHSGDAIWEAAGKGADRAFASTSWKLNASAAVETLSTTLQTGTAAIDLTGNDYGQAVVGNNGANRLDGAAGDDSVFGHGGDDVLIGGLGADLLDGGLGFDTADYSGATAAVTVNLLLQSATGGAGTDVVRDIERVVGSAHSDILRGNGVANTLVGGDGDDRLDGFQGADATYGGLGNDWHYVDNAADVVVEAAGEGTLDRVFASASYVLAAGVEIELLSTTLQAGSAAIDLTGNELGQGMAGNNGINRLDGGAGDDSLYGHNGDDVLIGGLGADLLDGGIGFDTADYSGAASAVSVNLLLQWATGGAGADTIKDVERVIGTGFHDVLRGSSAANTLDGGAGDDRLDGFQGVDTTLGGLGDDWHYVDHAGDTVVEMAGQGFDRVLASATYALAADADIELVSTTLQGGTAAIDLTGNGLAQSMAGNNGANRIDGQGGHDTLFGHGGSDTLAGGAGDDTLWGGAAADVFLYDAAGSGHDLIRDFADGADLIRFEASSGVDGFGDLAIAANGSGWAVITLPDGSTITLFGVAAASVDAADFVFGGA